MSACLGSSRTDAEDGVLVGYQELRSNGNTKIMKGHKGGETRAHIYLLQRVESFR
jgi:hypothetical protein